MTERLESSAIVIGASMAGLLAARVLTNHYARVTVIDRDTLPEGPDGRRSVPQAAHAHGLLANGLTILDGLFPGIVEDLVAGGAIEDDISSMAWYHYGTWKKRFHVGLRGMFQSRPYLDWHVRRRVAALTNLEILERHSVTQLRMSADGRRVTGVDATAPDGRALTLHADLVVDASGRGSRTPAFLEAASFPRPAEEEVHVDLCYATRIFRRTGFKSWKAMIVSPLPPHEKRMAVLFPIEGDRWILTLAGWLGDHPPTDEAGYADFARSLPVPDISSHIRSCEPLSGIGLHKFPSSLRRHYEKIRMPAGLVVMGDALASFNPAYGQGMTTAALEAMALSEWLVDQRARGQEPAFATAPLQTTLSRTADRAWMVSAGEDFRYPETRGVRAPGTDLINAYMGQVHKLAATDETVATAFYHVMHMYRRPEAMFHPAVLWRVLKAALWPSAPRLAELRS